MDDVQIIEADLTWTGQQFEPGIQIVIAANGEIEHIGMLDERPTHRLTDQALLPGFVNAHSHAFQRGLRGLGETFSDGSGSFWTWREAMYHLVSQTDELHLYELSLQAFAEMLAAGITTVGEFHYLHHDATCQGFAFDEVVLRAARDAGIRIVLLNAYYNTGGIGQPLAEPQRRFATTSLQDYWRQMDRLTGLLEPRTQSLGVVAHSIRASSIDHITALHAESRQRGMVFHIHVEEQRKEIEECQAAYGAPPMALLTDRLNGLDNVTAVHCTHSAPADLDRFIESGGTVCICPLTEANLGDGIADVPAMLRHGGRVCIGTDSNARICMAEELRWLEYVQRLRHKSRGVLRNAEGRVAPLLLDIGTVNGAHALNLKVGRIEPGYLADFVAVDLSAAPLAGWTRETLLDSFLFGTGNDAIAATCVGGRWHTYKPLSDSPIH